VLRLGKALQRWEPAIGTPLTDGSGEAEHEVRAAIHTAAIWLYVVAVLEQPEREDLQGLAQQRVRDYHLEVLRAAVAYNWLRPYPSPFWACHRHRPSKRPQALSHVPIASTSRAER
jgi:hypothetical protein